MVLLSDCVSESLDKAGWVLGACSPFVLLGCTYHIVLISFAEAKVILVEGVTICLIIWRLLPNF